MNADLQFLSETSDKLQIFSPRTLSGTFNLALAVVLAVVFSALIYRLQGQVTGWRRAVVWCVFGAGIVLPVATQVWDHTLTLSRKDGTATTLDRFAGIPYAHHTYVLSELREAIVQYARPGRRLALLQTEGGVVLPLGKAYNSQPSQYRAQQEINGFLSGGANAHPSSRSAGGLTGFMPDVPR